MLEMKASSSLQSSKRATTDSKPTSHSLNSWLLCTLSFFCVKPERPVADESGKANILAQSLMKG
eukprot:14623670-Ditylum_brightwellii.AAC.1